ncbi:MAG: AAA family ATPase [Deltaproteobacteria bacterium]|jgi:AAA15 family ATPase/GTPase|nr:AAA family ATPase [Deltaproteobacteria bacterium]
MITKISVKNYKCLKDFSVEDLRPINLIAGKNNVGKSTLLESIFLFFNKFSIDIFSKILGFRRIQANLSVQWLWKTLFIDMNSENNVFISLMLDNILHTTTFSLDPFFNFSFLPINQNKINIDKTIVNGHNYQALKVNYSCQALNIDYMYFFLLIKNELSFFTHNEAILTQNNILAQYLNQNIEVNQSLLTEYFSKLDLHSETNNVVEILMKIEQRLVDLSVIDIYGFNSLFADIGLPVKLPLAALGDGANKFAQIVLTLLTNPGSIVLIDGIENGFHYKFFPILWETLGLLVEKTGCQVFATTYSFECIEGAQIFTKNNDIFKNGIFRFIRLDNIKGVIKSVSFNSESFNIFLDNNFEIR